MKIVMVLMSAVAASVSCGQVVNGSFEQPDLGFRSVGSGQTYGGWTCTGPSDIEFVETVVNPGLPLLEASGYDGRYWIDLCGVGQPSGIAQTVVTVIGQYYDVTFAMAANVWGSAATFAMDVRWNGLTVGTFTHDTTGLDGAHMGWMQRSVTVAGTGSDVLEFRALTGFNARGPALDDVRMVEIPEPGVLAVVGLAGMRLSRRRR